jgi:hypothetical protein
MKYLKKFNEGYSEENWNIDISDMIGKSVQHIEVGDKTEITFYCFDNDGSEVRYTMYHDQDCCENVYLEDIVGDLEDLYVGKIIKAEEVTNRNDPPPAEGSDESYTWTYYNLATIEGYIQFRWFGTSNGYYSESMNILKTKPWYE